MRSNGGLMGRRHVARLPGAGADEDVLKIGENPQWSASADPRERPGEVVLVEVRSGGPGEGRGTEGLEPRHIPGAGVDGDAVPPRNQFRDDARHRRDVARERHHTHENAAHDATLRTDSPRTPHTP